MSRTLRILLVPSAYYPHAGGIEEMTRRLALELLRRGHEPLILTNRWPADTAAAELMDEVPVRRVHFELPAMNLRALRRWVSAAPPAAYKTLALVRDFRPAVIHLMGAGPNAAYLAALRPLLAAPLVLSVHGEFRNDAHGAFEQSLTLRLALRSLLRRATIVTACSQVALDEIRERLPITVPALVLPNAIEPGEFGGPHRETGARGAYVLAAGRLVRQKGIDLLLRAWRQSRDELAAHRLLIAGDGPERGRLQELADRLGLGARVSFLGTVERARLVELMLGAAAFAFPSRQEAFGLALLEAMAAGTPAVATRVGGIPEFASDGESALLVAPENSAELSRALVRLLSDPCLRDRLIAGGRAQASLYSWERIGTRYDQLYAKLAGG